MDRDLLNRVRFTADPFQLPESAGEDSVVKGGSLSASLYKLLFFFLVISALILGGKLAIEYTWAFCRGESHKADITDIYNKCFGKEAQNER